MQVLAYLPHPGFALRIEHVALNQGEAKPLDGLNFF